MRITLNETEVRMIERCIEEYRCTLTPDLEFFQEEDDVLKSVEYKLDRHKASKKVSE